MAGRIVVSPVGVALAALAILVTPACGGGGSASPPSTPTSPSNPSPPITGNPCSAFSSLFGEPQSIINGLDCSASQVAASSVVQLQLFDAVRQIGTCSGTIIASEWVLTAAHCLDEDVRSVRVYQGIVGAIPPLATEFHYSPLYTGVGPTSLDVGVVKFPDSLGRTPVPLLTSREAAGSETAVIAGWGANAAGVSHILRAGTATISSVSAVYLEIAFNGTASNICAGDSGGPLLLSQGGEWAVAGITSTATIGCASGTSQFAKVKYDGIRSFILSYVPAIQK